MQKFSDVLLELESADNIQRIEFFDDSDRPAGALHNKPGSAGSMKVYYRLYKMYGAISLRAAVRGLSLFAEHAKDAEENPGKHPNIDRLYAVIKNEAPLSMKIITV